MEDVINQPTELTDLQLDAVAGGNSWGHSSGGGEYASFGNVSVLNGSLNGNNVLSGNTTGVGVGLLGSIAHGIL